MWKPCFAVMLLLFSLLASGAHAAAPASPARQPQDSVPQMLDIAWSAGPPMPRGFQDNLVSVIDNWLVSVAGFCSGTDDDWKKGVYPRGFLKEVYGLDLDDEAKGWVELPSLPGARRQGMQGARVGDALYVWGGFSYSKPYTYTDGYRLSRKDGEWLWDELPPLPSPSCWAGTCTLGSKIYSLGGADYDKEQFYTLNDRTGNVPRLGARLIVLDTVDLDAGWKELTPCPGTPRCCVSTAQVGGMFYFIGGVAFYDATTYCNVVDSWRYDPAADTWDRLRDLPISGSGGNSSLSLYKGRYILMPAGYQYEQLMRIDGSLAPKYGKASTIERTWENHPRWKGTHYYNHCYVYDTRTNLYGTAPNLPFDDVASITAVVGDTAYILPEETAGFYWEGEYFGHHPEFVLKGVLKERDWESTKETP